MKWNYWETGFYYFEIRGYPVKYMGRNIRPIVGIPVNKATKFKSRFAVNKHPLYKQAGVVLKFQPGIPPSILVE